MKVTKSIQRRTRGKGANVVGDVNAAVVANTGDGGSSSKNRAVSRQRIVQRNGETVQDARSSSVEIEQDGE